MKRLSGKEAMMNKAEAHEPKRIVTKAPASAHKGKFASDVGNETKADMKGTQMGGSAAEAARNPLHHAMRELHHQHPIAHHDHGPHHGHEHHVRHEPLHGMTPHGGHKKHHHSHGG